MIDVRPDGSISGIDGMLDQISGALARQIIPMVKTTVLPVIQNDKELQRTVGRAAGREIAKPLWVLAGVAAVYVGWRIYEDGR